MSTYTLDFETIQQVMQEHQQTGLLYAELASGAMHLRESCRIEIKIMAGAVASCAIIGNSGRSLTGREATQELTRVGRIRWTFVPQQESTVQPMSPSLISREAVTVPRRYTYLSQAQMRTWPRMHRAVFALADGTKSIVKIAGILSVSPDLVSKTVRDLRSMGVLTMELENQKGPWNQL